MLALGAAPLPAIELRERSATASEARPPASAGTEEGRVSTTVRAAGSTREVVLEGPARDAAEDPRLQAEAATNGTYTGSVAGKPFSLTVAGGKITGWTVEDLDCPSFTITEASVSTSCTVAGNDSFTCGSLGCSPAGSMRITGAFSGNTVSGTFEADFQPFGACCSLRNLAFDASRAGGGGGSPPAAPSGLVATAVASNEIDLTWNDNASDESEFRVEVREGTTGAFTDVGAVGANVEAATLGGLDAATLYQVRVRARNAHGDSAYSNVASATTFGGATACSADDNTLCLSGGRFAVRATFAAAGGASGAARVVELTPDTGYLWFFSPTNVEAVIKVLNACPVNDRYWVFAGGLTDVHTVITVTDTDTGAVKTYTNPQGTAFRPIQDTGAFATCP
jgi:hypothetical protein